MGSEFSRSDLKPLRGRAGWSAWGRAGLLLALTCGAPAPLLAGKQDKRQQQANAAHTAEIAAAQQAAETWLKLQDAEDYDRAWQAASGQFQQRVPESAWQRRMEAVRKPLDPVLTRTLNTAEYKTQLPNLPSGQYVALVWETVFASGKPTLESVVMRSENGQWKMVGYAVE